MFGKPPQPRPGMMDSPDLPLLQTTARTVGQRPLAVAQFMNLRRQLPPMYFLLATSAALLAFKIGRAHV